MCLSSGETTIWYLLFCVDDCLVCIPCACHQEKQLYLCDTWYLLFCVDDCLVCIPDSHPHRITSTKCRTDTVVSPDDGHSRPKHVEKRNKRTKKNCAPSWLCLQDYTRMHSQRNIKHNIFKSSSNVSHKYIRECIF